MSAFDNQTFHSNEVNNIQVSGSTGSGSLFDCSKQAKEFKLEDAKRNARALRVELVHPDAKLPTRGSAGAAGLDLYACEDVMIVNGYHALVPTGIRIGLPNGTYGRIAPRSGLALKKAIDVGAGVIDGDYEGQVGVILFNHHPDMTFEIKKGDRIAQLIVTPYLESEVMETKFVDASSAEKGAQHTAGIRGAGGFGSTGSK